MIHVRGIHMYHCTKNPGDCGQKKQTEQYFSIQLIRNRRLHVHAQVAIFFSSGW